ncbi:MAG: FG-GAP-like repeat-containing protein [Phycisphaerales bacterium]
MGAGTGSGRWVVRGWAMIAACGVGVAALDSAVAGDGGDGLGFTLQDVTNDCGVLPLPAAFGMTTGVSAADIDDDGDIDLVVATAAGQRVQVYRNFGDGNFEEVSVELGLTATRRTRGTLLFDFDGDGRLDLVTASDCWGGGGCPTHDALRLYQQQGDGTFVDVTEGSGLEGILYVNAGTAFGGFAAGDLTGDGLLDLVVAYWNGKLRVFENHGDGSFTDIAVSAGFTSGENSWFWQPVIVDFNNDGLMDLFAALDFNPNRLFINNGNGTFTNHAVAAGVATSWNEMGVAVGDYDNDGRFDLFVTNIYNLIGGVQRHSVLFHNTTPMGQVGGIPSYEEVSVQEGVDDSGWGWGATFFDADHDTLQDLAVVNGRAGGAWEHDISLLYRNLGDGAAQRFEDVGGAVGFNDDFVSSTVLAVDLDRDGRLDLVQSNVQNDEGPGPLRVLMNRVPAGVEAGNWLMVRPRMPGSANHRAIGTVVRVTAGGTTMMRLIGAGISLAGQEPAEAHFGLGDAGVAELVEIVWADGEVTILEDVAANQLIDVQPGVVIGCQTLDVSGSGMVDSDDLSMVLSAYGSADAALDFDGSGSVDMVDLSLILSSFGVACQ